MHLVLFFQNLLKEESTFLPKAVGKTACHAFLDNETCLWETKMCVVIEGYEAKRSSGEISRPFLASKLLGQQRSKLTLRKHSAS
jgi:hypothetical protein